MIVSRRLLAVVGLALAACLPKGHREYEPLSNYERAAAAKAERGIFPEDVRRNPSGARGHEIAWAGTVKSADLDRRADRIRVTLDVEHHYYDWVETYSPSTAPIWLSPLGEGRVRVVWDIMRDTPEDALETITTEDNLVLIYGTPTAVDGPRVLVKAAFVRGIDRRYYSTHASRYGRESVPR